MTIIDKIKASVERIGIPFVYGSMDDVNEVISGHDFDGGMLCYCTLITTGTARYDVSGRWHDRVQIAIFIVNKTEFDMCSIENEDIVDACKREVYRWLVSLRDNRDIKLEEVTSSQRVYDEFDDIVTGYGVQATIEEVQGYGRCDYGN